MLPKSELRAKLTKVPDWIAMCEDPATDTVLMHQYSFAADHQEEEVELLGWAIKYAGLCGKHVQIVPGKKAN
jgi:hypothetical protein